ncbi:hypothetical protein BV898_15624 [Hypsibius exemplaris]|uniref:Uncharacterized protein n=1 Tax=Hypsibius exemplaris TaxID=2072580 RepID=A0A9X6RKP0_HYPEX|nr:hypothetical protein BV898_15624 [Hypsibius exemplaris]
MPRTHVETGDRVNIYKLYLAAKLKPQAPIDAADFISPIIKVVQITGKGRDVITAEAIQPGTCKALQADSPVRLSRMTPAMSSSLIQAVWKIPNSIGKSV